MKKNKEHILPQRKLTNKLEHAAQKARLRSMMDCFLESAVKTPITDEFKLSDEELANYKNSLGLRFDDALNQLMACHDYYKYLFESSQFSNAPEPHLYAMFQLMSELGFIFRSADPQIDLGYQGGMTPLVFAASHGDLKACKYLVAQGASVDQLVIQPGKPGTAPIIEALKSGSQELCRFLLLQGASLRDERGLFYPDYQSLVVKLLPEELVLFDKVQAIDEKIKEARTSYSNFIAFIDAQVDELKTLSDTAMLGSDAFLRLSRAFNNDGTFNNDEIFPPAFRIIDQDNWINVVEALKKWFKDDSITQALYWLNVSGSTLQTLAEHAVNGLLTRADLQAFQQAGGDLSASLEGGETVLSYVAVRSQLSQAKLTRMLGLLVSAGAPINATNQEGNTPLMIVNELAKTKAVLRYVCQFLNKLEPPEPLILSKKRSCSEERSEASEFMQPPKRALRRRNTVTT